MSLLDRFLEGIDSRHTRRAYRRDLEGFFGLSPDESEQFRVDQVTPSDIGKHVRSLRVEGLSVATQRRRLAALRRFYDWAMDRGHSERNPARACQIDLSRPSEADRDDGDDAPAILSDSDVETLIRAAEDAGESSVRDRGLLLTILYGALRRAEVAAMDVEHLRPLGRHWVIDLPAADAWSSAYVKVPDTVVEAIDRVQTRYDIDGGALWRSLSNRNRGARMTPDAIYKVVRRTGRRAGLPGVTVEALRQAGLHLAMDAGATVQQVQMHARLKTTVSAARYADRGGPADRLSESAVDFIDLDA